MRRAVIPALIVALLLLGPVPRAQAPRPLPDPDVLRREVRARLQIDDARQRDYIYTETERRLSVDGTGRAREEHVTVTESYPGLPGKPRWERRLQEDGRPVPAAELAKHDRERQQEAEAYLRKHARMTSAELDDERRDREKHRQEQSAMLDDAFRVFAFTMTGRERLGGVETIALTIEPRRDVKTTTRQGGWAKHFRGKAWVSESDYELARLDLEAIDTVSMGLGMLARLHEGSTLSFERRRMDDGVWLPARATIAASARVLLLKRLRLNTITEFSQYRKFAVETSSTYDVPATH